MVNKKCHKPIPYLSLSGAVGFALSLIALTFFEMTHISEPHTAADSARVVKVMVCVLLASLSSIVSIITALCPLILGHDRRPLIWVVPLLLGWLLFLQLFDWRSLVTHV